MPTVATRGPVLSTNLGPIVSIISWILVATVVLAVAVKLTFSTLATRRLQPEDGAIILSLLFSVGYTIALSIAVPNGVGKHQDSLSLAQLSAFQKAIYAADMLFIPTIASSQVSTLFFLIQVTPTTSHRTVLKGMGGLVLSVALASLIASAFQCARTSFWKTLDESCFDQEAFWTAYGVINILLELALTAIPVYIIGRVQFDFKRKIVLIGCFACRLAVIAAFIVQLVELRKIRRADDYTYGDWRYYLCAQFVQSLGVISQCIPYIRNLMLGLESGMIRTGHFRLRNNDKASPGAGEAYSSEQSAGSWGIELQSSMRK